MADGERRVTEGFPVADDAGAIRRFFEAGGALARHHPGFEPRPQQVEMAVACAQALGRGEPLLVEAGTGVGKSAAYLVPAILWAAREGKRVAVCTYTRALQEQLVRSDLPLLQRALASTGVSFRFALLMGGENYLCLQRLDQALEEGTWLFDAGERSQLERLAAWARRAESGLRSDLPVRVSAAAWDRVKRDADLCLGRRGRYWEACLYRKAVQRAREARIVVLNHALFFANLASGEGLLPPFDALVFDEAHMIEKAATDFLGLDLSNLAVKRVADAVWNPATERGLVSRQARVPPAWRRAAIGAAADLRDASERLFATLAEAARGEGRGGIAGPASPTASGADVRRIRAPGAAPNEVDGPLGRLAVLLREAIGLAPTAEEEQALAGTADRLERIRGSVATFLEQREANTVYWVEAERARRGQRVVLRTAPVDLGPALQRALFSGEAPVILTSATLAVGGSFAYLRERVGVARATERRLGSPYAFEEQVRCYFAEAMPDPRQAAAFQAAVARECLALLRITGGGTFILFTSYHLLNAVGDALEAEPALAKLQFLRQQPGEAAGALAAFRKARAGVLLGAASFWQGVDVPGWDLRCVIITRLPFEVPSHPVAEARLEALEARGEDPFVSYSLPEAILAFRQGFGRLIRSRDDRGVVAILDPRVRTRPYGRLFLESIPACPITSDLGEIEAFLAAASACTPRRSSHDAGQERGLGRTGVSRPTVGEPSPGCPLSPKDGETPPPSSLSPVEGAIPPPSSLSPEEGAIQPPLSLSPEEGEIPSPSSLSPEERVIPPPSSLSPLGERVRVRGPTDRARRLRAQLTDGERKLWSHLRSRQLVGAKFRRQHPIGSYIVDFCCLDRKLVVEVDGGHHVAQLEADEQRTRFLMKLGYRVLRFWDNDVLANTDAVLQQIAEALMNPHPNPLPGRERE
jgi:ATP-dependent DNA helicase DinG